MLCEAAEPYSTVADACNNIQPSWLGRKAENMVFIPENMPELHAKAPDHLRGEACSLPFIIETIF